jgi:hypothetical protein
MSKNGLKQWATLGITENPKIDNKKKNKLIQEKYLTSDFSRYGVICLLKIGWKQKGYF